MKQRSGSGGPGRVAAAEEGLRRIAREIHDDFGQRLASLAVALRVVRKQLPEAHSQLSEIDAIGSGLTELGEDLRRLSHHLHPVTLERLGLPDALRDHCAEIERRHGLEVDFRVTGDASSFPPDVTLGLYRIVQEALANTAHHAGAHTAWVTLHAASATARLTVADDGDGFDPGAARRAGGVGLASIEERAQLLGGGCRIASVPGGGTEIEVTVPLAAEDLPLSFRELARRHRGLTASAALVILALAAGLVAALWPARRER